MIYMFIFLILVVMGVAILLYEKSFYTEVKAKLSDCTCYNESGVCACNGEYTVTGNTYQTGLSDLSAPKNNGDVISVWVDLKNPYNATAKQPPIVTGAWILIILGIALSVVSLGLQVFHTL